MSIHSTSLLRASWQSISTQCIAHIKATGACLSDCKLKKKNDSRTERAIKNLSMMETIINWWK
jgi:hypothetical protein